MNTTLSRKSKWDLCAIVCVVFLTSLACAADEPPTTKVPARSVETPPIQPSAAATSRPKLHLKLSAQELNAIIANHRTTMIASNTSETELEEVVVIAPTELLPMRDPTRDIWGGLAAPFWAIAHPTQAWRIFLPIPPE